MAVIRLGDGVPRGVTVAILLASGALLYWLGVQAPNEDGCRRLPVGVGRDALPLIFAGLIVLGAGYEGPGPGTLLWTSAVVGALALWPAFERNSAISLLIAAILGGVVLIAASTIVLDTTSRVLMAVYALALVLCGLALREPARRHAEVLIDAAGAAIALDRGRAVPVRRTGAPGVLAGRRARRGVRDSSAFGAVDRSPGPAYLGVVNLVLFILVVGDEDDDLLWWPLVLLAGGIAMLVAGLRPRRLLPPEPDPYRAGEAPLAARADDNEIVVRVRDDSEVRGARAGASRPGSACA